MNGMPVHKGGQAIAAAERSLVTPSISITDTCAEVFRTDPEQQAAPTSGQVASPTHFLLYLNHDTFVGEAGEQLALEVRAAMAANVTIFMPHECDPARGGCQFEVSRRTHKSNLSHTQIKTYIPLMAGRF